MTLLSLASRQIWPQVLGFLHLSPRPDRLVLFHTDEEGESAGPARRLKELFAGQRLLPESAVELVRVPHDHFGNIVEALTATAERLGLDEANCRVHFTGGNKLMALAAAEWCRLAGTPCFYLERDLRVFPFLPRGTDLLPQESFQLNPHLAREIEPLALLRCQLGSAEVVGSGQRLTLNERGRLLPEAEIAPLLKRDEDFRKFLAWDVPELDDQPGFALEFATAVALLKLGVPVVQRSVRLVPKVLRGSGREEGELDLVFNWAGKLWVVDCKDRHSPETRVDRLRTEILRQVTPDPRLTELLARLADELRERDLHPLKEDLLAVAEVGGLLGRAICVRRAPLEPQAIEFARSRRLAVVSKARLLADLRPVLFPNEPASLEQLRSLAAARTGATA
ncbi:hypothetical protein LBMAG56_52150 [Verrucomicrobiota bacterium]|nr:hypothetical protein LBMAG56_52150 [Verrucomicrobiota bacterium]